MSKWRKTGLDVRRVAAMFGVPYWMVGYGRRPKYGPGSPKRWPKRGHHRRRGRAS